MEEEEESASSPQQAIAHDLNKKPRSSDVTVYGTDSAVGFEGLNLSEDVLKGLEKCSFRKPSPIQMRSIPLGKLGFDLLLQAKSGTGKTCVFSVIALENVDVAANFIQALVVSPCREIAFQSANVIKALGSFKEGLKVKIFIGGTPVDDDTRRIVKCHIAVGTPGRLVHLIRDYDMDLSKVSVFILDEADKLLDQSFFPDLEVIVRALSKNKQVIAASATYPDNLDQFILTFMRNPIKVQLDSSCPMLLAVEQVSLDVKKVMKIKIKEKEFVAEEEMLNCKFQCLKAILGRVSYSQAIIFCSHQFKAESIYEKLRASLIDVVLLSGSLDQYSRLDSLLRLQQGNCRLMVATDLAARGIDCENVDLVVNFDCPTDLATYIHRLGRAGRFGASGIGITFLSYSSETDILDKFQQHLNLQINTIEDLNSLEFLGKQQKSGTEISDQRYEVDLLRIPVEDLKNTRSNISLSYYTKNLNFYEKLPIANYLYQGIHMELSEQAAIDYKKKYYINDENDDDELISKLVKCNYE